DEGTSYICITHKGWADPTSSVSHHEDVVSYRQRRRVAQGRAPGAVIGIAIYSPRADQLPASLTSTPPPTENPVSTAELVAVAGAMPLKPQVPAALQFIVASTRCQATPPVPNTMIQGVTR